MVISRHRRQPQVPQLVRDTIAAWRANSGRWTASPHRHRAAAASADAAQGLDRCLPTRRASRTRTGCSPVGVPLRDELASVGRRRSRLSHGPTTSSLLAVNDWLRRTDGGDVPAGRGRGASLRAPPRREGLRLLTPPRGGCRILWGPGRADLRVYRAATAPRHRSHGSPPRPPLGAAGTDRLRGEPRHVPHPAAHTSREQRIPSGSPSRGSRAATPPRWRRYEPSRSPSLASTTSATSIPAGLAIAATACAVAESVGTPAQPAEQLWELLVQQPHRPGPTVAEAEARRLVKWLPASIRYDALALFTGGRRVPQEALRMELLVDTLASPKQQRQA